jgi:GST-like protein
VIDLHFVRTPNGQKVSILLEELGLPYRAIPYDMLKGEHLTPEFRRINPNCRLPAIVDHEPAGGGEPLALFESGAILIYLADKAGRFIPAEPRARAVALQWLMWQMSGLGPMHGQAHHFVRYCVEPVPYALNRYLNEARRLLQVLDRRLGEAEYLAGEYSIADIACWPWVRAARAIDIDIAGYANVKRWYKQIDAREAVRRGGELKISDASLAGKPRLSPEQWSNLFGDNMLNAVR